MDASAKRFLWSRVKALVTAGRSVLLTSHSMEECEALCDRMAIMAGGRLRCVGTPAVLRATYGSGHTLQLTVSPEQVNTMQAAVSACFAGARLQEAHLGHIRFHLAPEDTQPLSAAFAALEELRARTPGLVYHVAETSLEDVFLRFAQAAATETDSPATANAAGAAGRRASAAANKGRRIFRRGRKRTTYALLHDEEEGIEMDMEGKEKEKEEEMEKEGKETAGGRREAARETEDSDDDVLLLA